MKHAPNHIPAGRTPCAGLVAMLLVAPAALAEVRVVTVEGEAAVIDGNPEQTEADARRDARRKAVEMGVGVLVTSNSIVRNYQLIADEVATAAKGVISDEQWGPLTDGATKTTKKITLTARVSPEAIEGAICSVIKQNHDPRISLVFVEKVGDESKWSVERGMIEAMFTGAFKDACFTIVESGVRVTEVSANGDLSQDTINQIVKNSKAQYVVLGSGKALRADTSNSPVLGDSVMQIFQISANLRLISTSTNEVEAVAFKAMAMPSISPEKALQTVDGKGDKKQKLVQDVMDQLMKKIVERWSADMLNAGRVQVVVQGVTNFAAANSFRDLVKKLFARGKVERREVQSGQAVFDVDAEGGAEALATALEGRKAGKLTVEVLEVSRGKVVLKLDP